MAGRRLAATVVLFTVLLLQLVVVNRIAAPGGPINLLLVVVACLALIEGPGAGMAYGFAAGLIGDLLSTHTLGRLALVWTIVGYGVGLFYAGPARGEARGPVLVPLLAVGVGGLVATLGYAALAVIVGAPHEASRHIAVHAIAVALYGMALTPFVFVPLRALLVRLNPAEV